MALPNLFPQRLSAAADPSDQTKSASRFSLSPDRSLCLNGIITILSDVPKNLTLSAFSSLPHATDTDSPPPRNILESVESKSQNGAFLGLSVEEPHDRILNPIGKLLDRKFLSIFRFKTWWSTMWVGSNGSDLQMETQLILLQVPEINSYALVVPLIEGSFRSAIHPGANGDVVLCVESGSMKVKGKTFSSCAYLHVGDNPYDLMRDAFAAVRVHLGTFRLLEEKTLPKIVDKFGWCSWDAFYLTVEPVGLWHGVKSFVENGFPPRFLIIDDGWQSINMDNESPLGYFHYSNQTLYSRYPNYSNQHYPNYSNQTLYSRYPNYSNQHYPNYSNQTLYSHYPNYSNQHYPNYSNQTLYSHYPNQGLMFSKDLLGLGSQMLCRLCRVEENDKFAKYQAGAMLKPDAPTFDQEKHDKMFREMVASAEKKSKLKIETNSDHDPDHDDHSSHADQGTIIEYLNEEDGVERGGLKAMVSDLKTKFPSLDDVYVWHALCGAWGGVRPGTMTGLDAKVTRAKLAAGLEKCMYDLAVDMIVKGGIGLVNPDQAADLYESMHSYLADAGISGVKVDVIQTLEYVSEDHGGRVQLAKRYYDGLSQSLKKNFGGSGLIASMEQCNDFFFLATKEISIGRVGDDFWFEDPNGDPMGVCWLQGVHMIHCSYNSLWQGQFIQPDWDMFQSDHLCAEFHAGSRAICGGPVYVSDKVGRHNFHLLRKLVLPDGTILKCQHYALPTRDCLFQNPLFDGETLLKLWNLNKYSGVVGVFNCQGAGWYPKEHKCKAYPQFYKSINGVVSPDDVEWEQKDFTAQFRSTDQFAVYLQKADNVQVLRSKDQISITVQPTSFEIFTFCPVQKLNGRANFAPIGLENMFNSGGAIEFLEYGSKTDISTVTIKVKGSGTLLAYSSEKPKKIILNGEKVEFEWSTNGILRFAVPWIAGGLSDAFISIS